MSIARRVLARYLQADLTPPLGYPGGPCQVVDRIEHDIRSPRLRDELVEDVETNQKITNPDAAKIYHLEHERGVGIAKRMEISPHAQYRMDLRGVTVPAVRAALASFSKLYFSLKSQKGPQFQSMDRELRSGQPFRWTDPKMGLTVVFVPSAADAVTVVTAFWADGSEPRATPGECAKTASHVPEMLYHGTSPPNLVRIAHEGLRSRSGTSRFGPEQTGVSTTRNLSVVSGGAFGNLILGIKTSGLHGVRFVDHQDPSVGPEDEIRIVAEDGGETVIPFRHVTEIYRVTPSLAGYEIRDLSKLAPGRELFTIWHGKITPA